MLAWQVQSRSQTAVVDGGHGSGTTTIYYTFIVSERLVYNKSNKLHIIMEISLSVGRVSRCRSRVAMEPMHTAAVPDRHDLS